MLRVQRLEGIGTLACGIAHDLNNILAPVMMCTDLLKSGLSPAALQRSIDSVANSAQRGAELVKQLLTFGRGVEGERKQLELSGLIKEIARMVQETFPRSIQFSFSLESDLPLVSGDVTQLHQVLLNLVVNARDAMPNGGTLQVAAMPTEIRPGFDARRLGAPPGRYVCLKVDDNGMGIPRESLDRIFEPFFTTKAQGKGTGLGLSTTVGIIKSHGGFIDVDSRPGQGTTFSVYLPAADASSAPAGGEMATQPTCINLGGRTILMVDDEDSIRSLVRDVLEYRGARVHIAADGKDGITIYEAHAPEIDVIITDVDMPVMNGLEFVRHVRGLNTTIPIIVSTGLQDRSRIDCFRDDFGVEHFLDKPFTVELLCEELLGVLSSS